MSGRPARPHELASLLGVLSALVRLRVVQLVCLQHLAFTSAISTAAAAISKTQHQQQQDRHPRNGCARTGCKFWQQPILPLWIALMA